MDNIEDRKESMSAILIKLNEEILSLAKQGYSVSITTLPYSAPFSNRFIPYPRYDLVEIHRA